MPRALPISIALLLSACSTSGDVHDVGGNTSSAASTTAGADTTASGSSTTGAASTISGTTSGTTGTSHTATSSSGTTGAATTSGHGATTGTTTSAAASMTGTTGSPYTTRTIGSFVGINGFPNSGVADAQVAGALREYHDWQWAEGNGASSYVGYPGDLFDWTTGPFNFDAFYGAMFDGGVDVMPCMEEGISFVNNYAIPPAASGVDPTTPAAYVAHADAMYQFAARYGSTAVDTSRLKLEPGQPQLTGLGWIHSFENGNEDDAYWILPNDAPVTSAAEMAALCSADDDGDQGRLLDDAGICTFGVKQADPNAQLVLAGLAQGSEGPGPAIAYLNGIVAWANANRGGSIPFDVINIHHYDTTYAQGQPALSPEADGLATSLQQYVTWRDQNAPGKPLWITEFGYDTDPLSDLVAPAIGGNTPEVTQGQWLVRALLAILQGGFDRAYIYILGDACTGSDASCETMFETAGIVTQADTRKAAWYMVNAFRTALAPLQYQGLSSSGVANVDLATFSNPAGGGAYALWCPTSNDTTVSAYALQLGATATHATQVELADQQPTGIQSTLTISGSHQVTIDVSETPTLVLVDSL